MIVKVVIPDSIYARVYFARGEQGPQGATGPQGSPGATGATGPQGPAGANGTSYTPGDPIYVTVRNSTGSPLLKGSIVYVSGSNGNHVQVSLAQAIGDITSARTIGWVADTIPNNTEGLIMVEGYLTGLNTQGITAGAQLYLSPTVPGGFTQTKPVAPDHMVYVGVAVKISAGDGHVYVKVQNGYELAEIHDVKITSPVNNQVLTYDSATDLWVNATNPADGVTSITAASPLTGGTITSTGSIGLDQSLLTVTQSQVTGLVTALAETAKLASANTFSVGGHIINNNAVGTVPLQINGVASQTADLIQVRDNFGNNNLSVSSTYGLVGRNAGNLAFALSSAGGIGAFYSQAAANIPLLVRGASGQTADLTQWQNNTGGVVAWVQANGSIFSGANATFGSATSLARLTAIVGTPTNIGAVIRGAASQTANLQEWQNSAGVVQALINPFGAATFGTNTVLGRVSISTGSTGTIGAVVRGVSGQTANLQEWQNDTGTVLARIGNLGSVFATDLRTTNVFGLLGEENSGGRLRMVRQTTANSNPGANVAVLYFRDGTNAGTLRLCVRAGAAGAETTILDNIPT